MQTNVLYYADNLDVLCRYLSDAAVDVVYLDPPLCPRKARASHA